VGSFSDKLHEAEGELAGFFRGAFREGEKLLQDLSNLAEMVKKEIAAWIARPEVLRMLLEDLQRLRPNLVVGQKAFVTKYADVLEVLKANGNFTVASIYADKMRRTSGDFILGMEDTPQYRREAGILHAAIHPDDFARIREFDRESTEAIITQALPQGRMDVAGGLFRQVPARLVSRYFGVPGPDEPTQMRWMRTIFWEIFLNFSNDPQVAQAAEQSSAEMKAYLGSWIMARKALMAQGRAPDDFLTRLLALQAQPETRLDDEGVGRNVGGVVVGAVDTTCTAASQALDELLKRPDQLEGARQAALAGNDALFSAYVFEALRFHPLNPLLLRHCEKDYTLAAGTPRQALIPAGSEVFAMTLGGMMDPEVFPHPEEFRTDRPYESYIIFGYGQHRCFGEPINRVQVPALLKSVVALKGLRRAPGEEGQIHYDGPFPDRLVVEFDGR